MQKNYQHSTILLLLSAIGVVGANSLVLSPIAGDVASSFEGSDAADIMLASAAYGAGTALSALFLAPKADQFGLGRSLFLALIVLGISFLISALAPVPIILITAQALAGLAAGVALPAIYGLSAEIAPKGKESQTLGKVLTGWTLSLVFGVTLSAMLSDVLHWRAVFGFLTALAALLAVLLLRSGHARPVTQKSSVADSPLGALSISGLLPILMMVATYMTAFYGLYAFIGTHLTETLGLSTAMAGLSALAYGVGFGAVAPLDRLIDRFGQARSAPAIFACLALAYLTLATVSGSGILVITMCLLWGAANHLGLNLLVGALTSIKPERRATILGLYGAVTYASMFVGTTLYKPLFEQQGFLLIALLSACLILPAILYSFLRLSKQLKATT